MYPAELTSPYLDRFSAAAAQRYEALGIERDDPDRPRKIAALNSEAFGAPVVLFCYLDRTMGPGQWADARECTCRRSCCCCGGGLPAPR